MLLKQTIILLLLAFVFSCKSAKPVLPSSTNTTKTITVTEVVKDTIVKTEKDSTYYKAWLKCQDGKVVIEKEAAVPKKTTKSLQNPAVKITDNVLEVDCITKATEMFLQWKEHHQNEVVETIIREPYPVEKDLSWWEQLCIGLGKVSLLVSIAFAIRFILKLKNIIS